MPYPSIGALRTARQFLERIDALDLDLPCDEGVLCAPESPLAERLDTDIGLLGNRWCVLPMEGWDATSTGAPSDHTRRRWTRFGESGAKLIWGGESVAVGLHARAHPTQLALTDGTAADIEGLRRALVDAHAGRFGGADDLIVGLQLTHAGRWTRSDDNAAGPRAAYRHPLLDGPSGVIDDTAVMSDDALAGVAGDFVAAAVRAGHAGFDFVDLMHAHGNLLHECLGAQTRPGRYGGDFAGRTTLLREIVAGIRRDAPELGIGVRVSAFDVVPFTSPNGAGGEPQPGAPVEHAHLLPYVYGFGVNADDPTQPDLTETHLLLDVLAELDITLVSVTAGSPHSSPHLMRPLSAPPSGEYAPPEDPLVGVVRLLEVARDLKYHHADAIVVGGGFSYLQEYLPHVAQAVLRENWVDVVGLGRVMLSYHDLPADVLEHGKVDRARICRTLSACSTAPREGRISGCYPQDPYYAQMPDVEHLRERR